MKAKELLITKQKRLTFTRSFCLLGVVIFLNNLKLCSICEMMGVFICYILCALCFFQDKANGQAYSK